MALSEEELAELKEANGGVLAVDKSDEGLGVFVFKKPNAIAAKRFRTTLGSDKRGVDKDEAWPQLLRDCLTYPKLPEGKPDLAALNKLIEEYSFLPTQVGADLIDAAGGGESHVKKL